MSITDNGFSATRRLVLKGTGTVAMIGLGAGLGIIAFDPQQAFAAANDKYPEEAFKQKSEADAIKTLYGKAAEPSDKVKLDAPEIAENGAGLCPIRRCRGAETRLRPRQGQLPDLSCDQGR